MHHDSSPQDPENRLPRQSGADLVPPGGLFGKIVAAILALTLLGVIFALSLVFLALVLVAGVVFWGYFKYRAWARRRGRSGDGSGPGSPPGGFGGPGSARTEPDTHPGGLIIEGEASRTDLPSDGTRLPR